MAQAGDIYRFVKGGFRAAKGQRKASQDKFLSRDEFASLLQAANDDESKYGQDGWSLFAIAGNFGLRCSEALSLTRADFKTLGMGYFRVGTLKRRAEVHDRVYVDPAHADLCRDVLSYRHGGSEFLFPFTSRTARYLFGYYATQAGLSNNVSFHSLRHTAARMVLIASSGCGDPTKGQMRVVKYFLRHRPTPSEIYTEPMPEEMISVMKVKGVVR